LKIARSLLAAALVASTHLALAQDYPSRAVRIIVSYAPGAENDRLARLAAQHLADQLKQPVLVENKPGAARVIGSEFVARSAGDGYTLMIASSSHAINPTLYSKINFDTVKDFSCITQTASQHVVLVTHPSLPVSNVRELIAYAKAHPGTLNFASPSKATQLPMELFNAMAGTPMTNVPYKGSGPALTDQLAGRIQVGFGGAASVMPHVRAGKLRALAIGDDKRSSLTPDLPTVAEAGLPGFQATVWTGFFAPSSTPRAIVRWPRSCARARRTAPRTS